METRNAQRRNGSTSSGAAASAALEAKEGVMCPICLTTAALLAAGTGITAGITGMAVGKRRSNPRDLPLAKSATHRR